MPIPLTAVIAVATFMVGLLGSQMNRSRDIGKLDGQLVAFQTTLNNVSDKQDKILEKQKEHSAKLGTLTNGKINKIEERVEELENEVE